MVDIEGGVSQQYRSENKTDHDQEGTQPPADEDVTDLLIQYRGECVTHTGKWKKLLDECTERVNAKAKTKESCHYEMVDYIQALDHCVLELDVLKFEVPDGFRMAKQIKK